jgi:hypothetical protein
MANTYKLIASVTNTGSSNITFSSIPATYTDLCVKISAADSSGNQTIFMVINGDTGSNYGERILKAYAAANVGSSTSSPRANIYSYTVGDIPTIGANYFNNGEIYIPNYASSNYKSMSYDAVISSQSSTLDEVSMIAGLWSSTAAITSLLFYSGGSSLATNSSIYLYGISKT